MRLCRALLGSLALFSTPYLATSQAVCPAGVQPDGFINWSHLPPAPLLTTGTSTPVTATFPVDGLPQFSVTVQIPALTAPSPSPTPAYTVNGDQLTLNGTSSNGATSVLLKFSSPPNNPNPNLGIAGASVNGAVAGTLENLTLTAFNRVNPQNVLIWAQGRSALFQFSPLQVKAAANYITSLQLSTDTVLGMAVPVIWSNLRIESGQAPIIPALPTVGLMQWLLSEDANPIDWNDLSGNGHDASQTNPNNAPVALFDGPNCRLAIDFSSNKFMNFTLPISGWNQMTVFLVAKSHNDSDPGSYYSNDAAIFWNENQFWGNTFVSPYWTHANFRFGTTQVGNNPSYSRPTTIGGDFTLTTAVHNEGTDSLYVNGVKVFEQGGKLSALGGTDGTGFLGRGINNTYYNGEISEVLVYNRVLTNKEMQTVTSYLETKFGLLPGAP